MTHRLQTAMLLIVLSLAAGPRLSYAQWRVTVCANVGGNFDPTIVSDGASGAIITWTDGRSDEGAIYAQHVLASGLVDPAWPVDGRAVCTAAGAQSYPTIVTDGAGGAIITWGDFRSGPADDIYAQHLLGSGVVDPAWPINGRALCVAAGRQLLPQIVTDGAGGAIVTWTDVRNGGLYDDIYAQHVLASGEVDPSWPVNGQGLCTGATSDKPQIATDGAGGAIVTWHDLRSGDADIYAQRVLATGAVDPAWPVDGRVLCAVPITGQANPTIVSDGVGGAIVTWEDLRNGSSEHDVYAQRVSGSGLVDPAWPVNGRALCTATYNQDTPQIVTDGAGGAIVKWNDSRTVDYDIYAQHVLASGVVDPGWPANGRALCISVGNQGSIAIVSDGAGGAIVPWVDRWDIENTDLYVQHVLASGVADPAWTPNGTFLCGTKYQGDPQIVTDMAGGGIVTWLDYSSGRTIYASRVLSDGTVSALASLVDAAAEPGVVRLHWYTPDGSVQRATVERTEVGAEFVALGEVDADGAGHLRYEDRDVTAGTTYQYRLALPDGATIDYLGQVTIRVPAAAAFGIDGFRPNPADGPVSVAFALGSAAPARLELLDVAGRRVLSQEVGMLGPGQHVLRLELAAALPAGVYVLRLTQSGRVATARSAIVR